jgi:hypothetical protein
VPSSRFAQHGLDHEVHLADVIDNGNKRRLFIVEATRAQVLGEALAGEADDSIRGGEDRLGRTVVLLERHHCRRWTELSGKVQDVAYVRGAETVDGLGIVADHRQTMTVRLQSEQDRGLQRVGALIFIDEHVVEVLTDLVREFRDFHELAPIEEQVIVVEHLVALLGFDVDLEQITQLVLPLRAPGKLLSQHGFQRLAGIHGTRIDRKASGLERESAVLIGEAALVSHQV